MEGKLIFEPVHNVHIKKFKLTDPIKLKLLPCPTKFSFKILKKSVQDIQKENIPPREVIYHNKFQGNFTSRARNLSMGSLLAPINSTHNLHRPFNLASLSSIIEESQGPKMLLPNTSRLSLPVLEPRKWSNRKEGPDRNLNLAEAKARYPTGLKQRVGAHKDFIFPINERMIPINERRFPVKSGSCVRIRNVVVKKLF
jgi:hypothetical protein